MKKIYKQEHLIRPKMSSTPTQQGDDRYQRNKAIYLDHYLKVGEGRGLKREHLLHTVRIERDGNEGDYLLKLASIPNSDRRFLVYEVPIEISIMSELLKRGEVPDITKVLAPRYQDEGTLSLQCPRTGELVYICSEFVAEHVGFHKAIQEWLKETNQDLEKPDPLIDKMIDFYKQRDLLKSYRRLLVA